MEFLPKARRVVVTPEDRHKIARLYGSGESHLRRLPQRPGVPFRLFTAF